jgi:hypothetical protein
MHLDTSQTDLVLFELQSVPVAQAGEASPLGYVRLTLLELERCIPWIPLDKRIVIDCSGGYSSQIMNRLNNLHTTRHLYLLKASKQGAQATGLVRV